MTTAFALQTARTPLVWMITKNGSPLSNAKHKNSVFHLVLDTLADDNLRWTKCTSLGNLSNQQTQLMMTMVVVLVMDKRPVPYNR